MEPRLRLWPQRAARAADQVVIGAECAAIRFRGGAGADAILGTNGSKVSEHQQHGCVDPEVTTAIEGRPSSPETQNPMNGSGKGTGPGGAVRWAAVWSVLLGNSVGRDGPTNVTAVGRAG